MQEMRHKITGALRREFFIADEAMQLEQKMDARRSELESQGYTYVRRAKVGRNAPCPCGSGAKFKKCHIDRVAELNLR